MTFAMDVAGRRVLVLGAGARALATVTRLLAEHAVVTVRAGGGEQPTTTLVDLAARGLIELADADTAVSTLDWDLVVNAEQVASAEEPAAAPPQRGEVILVSGGPGDPGLLTVAGLDAVRRADVIVVDRLAPLAVLDQARADVRLFDVGKIPRGKHTPQEDINDLLVEHALAGRTVVRLKGGDAFVFGRGGEEWLACVEAGVPVSVIPGVTSAIAAPALAGIPVTHRSLSQGFTVVSGHLPPDRSGIDWSALAASRTTLVILMGVATLPDTTAVLLRYLAADTPAAIIADAGLPSMRSLRSPLGEIAAAAAAADIQSPAVVVIGAVAGFNTPA